jgi:hypothetical protein
MPRVNHDIILLSYNDTPLQRHQIFSLFHGVITELDCIWSPGLKLYCLRACPTRWPRSSLLPVVGIIILRLCSSAAVVLGPKAAWFLPSTSGMQYLNVPSSLLTIVIQKVYNLSLSIVNQPDALVSQIYLFWVDTLHVSGGLSGVQDCTYSNRCMSNRYCSI